MYKYMRVGKNIAASQKIRKKDCKINSEQFVLLPTYLDRYTIVLKAFSLWEEEVGRDAILSSLQTGNHAKNVNKEKDLNIFCIQ